jgi:LuxR family maltose regulon positive regulatory protein
VLSALVTAPYFTDKGRADYHLRHALADVERLSMSARVLLYSLFAMRSTTEQDDDVVAQALARLDLSLADAESVADTEWLDAALFAETARAWVAVQSDDAEAGLEALRGAAEDARRSRRHWLHLLALDIAASAAARLGRWAETYELQRQMREVVPADGPPHDLVSARTQFAVAAAAYEEAEPFAVSRVAEIIAADRLALDAGLSVPAHVLRVVLCIDDEPNPRKLYEELDQTLRANARSSRRTLAAVFFRYLDLTIRLQGRAQARSAAGFIADTLGEDCLEAQVGRVMLAHGTSSQAAEERALIARLEGEFRAWNPSTIVLGWLLLADYAEGAGRTAAADARLEHALDVARPLRVRRPFLAARGMGGALLASRAGRLGVNEEFAASVLDLYREQHPTEDRGDLASIVFTVKEHEILRELPRHQSVGEIALKQRLSPNTIKTHLRAIYQKLGVSGRTEAVEKAMAAGLL